MGQQCTICGKKPATGKHYARRGKAKYRGGVGRRFSWKRVWSNREHITVTGLIAVAALIGLKFLI